MTKLHAYSCADHAAGKPKCERWCGQPQICVSTQTYRESYMQSAYEHGFGDAVKAAAALCDGLAKSTSPHRRVAGQDMAEAIRALTPGGGQ